MAIRAGLGIHKKSVKQTESLRQRMMIGSHHLLCSKRPSRGVAVPENRNIGFPVRNLPIARCFHVAKHLIIGAILLDDVDDVFDRALARKKLGRSKIHEAVILHGLLRVACQRRFLWQRNHADVSGNDGAAVLPTLSVFFLMGGELCVRWIGREPAVADPHGGWFESRAFPISDEEFAVCHGNCGGILTRRNKPEDL